MDIIYISKNVSHVESKDTCIVSVCYDLTQCVKSDANQGNLALMIFKHLNSLHELCVTPSAAATNHAGN